MDISSLLEINPAHEFEVLHPQTGEGLSIFVSVQSVQSDAMKEVVRKTNDQNIKMARKNKPLTTKMAEEQAIAHASAAIVSWRWENADLDIDGESNPPCSDKNKRKALEIDWFFDQVQEQASDLENFTKKPVKN